jgi:hypothetical protein
MLASTVQFSNNDQPPTTPNPPAREHWDRPQRPGHPAAPSDTQQRAQPQPRPVRVPHPPTGGPY